MAEDDPEPGTAGWAQDVERPGPRRRRWPRVLGWLGLAVVVALAIAWFSRERIADDVIAGQLEDLGLPARYTVAQVEADRQVLANVVIGDPRRPDLTIERVEVALSPRFGAPAIGRVTLVKPRLYGTYVAGKLSFGSLDPLIFTGSKEPFRLPDLDLAVRDGRALLQSDKGDIGLKLDGAGGLRDGFAGYLAAVTPNARLAGCTATRASLFADIRIAGEKPRLKGPLRLAGLDCPGSALKLARGDVLLDATLDQPLDGGEARFSLAAQSLAFAGNSLRSVGGDGRIALRQGDVTAHYALTGVGLGAGQVAARTITLDGALRSADRFARVETEGTLGGTGLQPGPGLDAALAGFERSGEGTLAAPLVARVRTALRREGAGSRLNAGFILRRTGEVTTLVVPQAELRGTSGQALLSLSRLQLLAGGAAPARFSGNFATGGRDMPRIAGRMERAAGGRLALRVQMPEYRAADASLALPQLTLVQGRDGTLGFSGLADLSGPLPGGSAQRLRLPLEGAWSPARGLAMWRECIDVRFERLQLANLSLIRRSLPLCPAQGGAIVRSDGAGLRIAAGAPRLDIAGTLGKTPIRIASGPVGFAVPGVLAARRLDIALGPAATASRFTIDRLDARIGKDIAGTFAGSEVRLNAVPLDLLDTAGAWRYAGGRLTIADAAFRLEDRTEVDRFQPLLARGATLALADSRIVAEARLSEPESGREVVRALIRHDLANGGGDADLLVDNLLFDKALQPDMITRQALGVVANVEGTVRGSGHIDWRGPTVESTGTFGTDKLDFAAAFGPVTGASGKMVFTDLLNFVTAPNQEVHVASMNPGIEVGNGSLRYELQPGSVLAIHGGSWPFTGGTLTLRPARMNIGIAETRRYTLDIEGLDAARLLTQMDMSNLSATGVFDGSLPLVFDEEGGRIEGGQLRSRAPGGNVAYVGQLTYKDLSTMANFAFDALKSIDYREMRIDLDGSLAGEIVTRVSFEGLSQGKQARSNFVTRQVAKLPLKFNVNIRAPFFQLVTSLRSIYDPAYVRDPRTLGMFRVQDGKLVRQPLRPVATQAARQPVQPRESADTP